MQLSAQVKFLPQNASETVWRPGSIRYHWESLSAPSGPLARFNG